MHEYLWLASQCISNCVRRGGVCPFGAKVGCRARTGEDRRQAEEGLALSCFPVVLHWHLGNIIRWHRQQLCIHYVHISCFVDPNRFRCYFTRHSLRFVYVNIYVKCALGFYKCHRGRGTDRNRKQRQSSPRCTHTNTQTTSDILKASPHVPLQFSWVQSIYQLPPSPPSPGSGKKKINHWKFGTARRVAQVTICTYPRKRCSGGRCCSVRR